MNGPEKDLPPRKGQENKAPGEHPWGDRGQIIALAAFFTVWVLDSFVLRASTVFARSLGLPVRLGASALIMALAVYFVQGGHRAAAPHSRTSPDLIIGGAFGRVRHPLYAGSLMFYLSLVVATLSLASLAVWGAVFAFYDIIASYEERRLAEAFGPAYLDYRARVPKWVPRLRAARAGRSL